MRQPIFMNCVLNSMLFEIPVKMSRSKLSQEKDVKRLVTCITEFEGEEENFDLCVDFALSNVKYHRFLDPDSHKLHRTINGLVEKFKIHSQNEKAVLFEALVSKFLESPVFEQREQGKTNTHYAVMSLLLCLSESPTYVTYTEPKKRQEVVGEMFDWTSYLNEGIDLYRGPFPDSPEWSEDEDLDETKTKSKITFSSDTPDHHQGAHSDTFMDDMTLTDDLDINSSDWLRQNLVVEYWCKPVHIPIDGGTHRESNLCRDWEAYQANISSVLTPTQKILVTEHQIIRETLWLLSGVRCSVVYVWFGAEYKPNADLSVTHLTQESLSAFLHHICHYGSLVRHLYDFVDHVSQGASLSLASDAQATGSCQTYQALSAALSVYLQDMQRTLVQMENTVCDQVTVSTLSTTLRDLKPKLAELDTLQTVYTKGIAAYEHVNSMSQKASGLLGAMFDILMECDNMGEHSRDKVSLLLLLWVKSCKPYLDIIDKWSTYGELVDPHREFVIQRNIDIRSLDEHFWDTGFTLHCVDPTVDDSYTELAGQTGRNHLAPSFLLPVLDQIILAGKSMELIQNLGKLSQVLQGVDRKSLYETFIESMEITLGSQTDSKDTGNDPQSVSVVDPRGQSSSRLIFNQHIAEQMRLPGVSDPLLRVNFINMFNANVLQAKSLSSQEEQIHGRLAVLELDSLTPVQLLLQTCLYPHISKVSMALLTILKQEYKLMDYFGAIRKYFLMESGDAMYDFYTHIFDKLRLQESWQDVSFLTSSLQEAVQARYPDDVDNVYVTIESVTDRPSKGKQLVTALEGLTLHYQVPWPIDIIINSRCIRAYNQVFGFLLQIKRVKYSLDELRFTDLERKRVSPSDDLEQSILGRKEDLLSRRQVLIHNIHMIRMKLMHFVNSLHSYIMTRILYSTGQEFASEMQEATDLDAVIHAHNTYISKLHERCLLHKKVSFIKDIVTKVLNLALIVAFKWDEGVDSIGEKQLVDIESEFSRCIQFLSSFLNNIIKRGSFPHLESLAFTLVTSNEAIHSS